jgi:hypothetical protein
LERIGMHIGFLLEKETDYKEDLDIRRIILKWIYEKNGGLIQT